MAGVIHGTASWPGAIAVESCTYTISHGITPGVAILRIQPQDDYPDTFGDLVISDGNETVVIPGCKVDALKIEQGEGGTVWDLEIVDRRWRWRTLGSVDGSYNQLDIHAKLHPFMIHSPTELAAECLAEMGETGYELYLPPGINYPGPLVSQPIVNVSGVNPPVDWVAEVPAQKLQETAEKFGCRVIYRLSSDSVLVRPAGDGDDLPPGSIHKQSPSLKDPETPSAVGVVGAATRYQMRLVLEAVGEEWDGSYRPINYLSYAPDRLNAPAAGLPQKNSIAVSNPASGVTWVITIQGGAFDEVDGGTIFVHCTTAVVVTALDEIAAGINGGFDFVTAEVVGAAVVVTGKMPGVSYTLTAQAQPPALIPAQDIAADLVQAAVDPLPPGAVGTWENCAPPLFGMVKATDRLTYFEAVTLAQKSVFKTYRLTGVDVSGEGPIRVPGFGTLVRRQQVVLQDTQVDQVAPEQKDKDRVDKTGLPFNVDFYNGYSRDKPAAVYGSVYNYGGNGGVWYKKAADNTPEGSRVFTPFSVDPVLQQITFSDYVYRLDGGSIAEPDLALQTAVNVRDPRNNQLACYKKVVPVPGATADTLPQMARRPDVQLEVTSTYDINNDLQGYTILDADPINRADYYIAGMLQPYRVSEALTREYNGILAIDLDGAISQVTWSVGPQGASTTASRNTEHDVFVAPYPARRRREFLPPIPNDRVDLFPRDKP